MLAEFRRVIALGALDTPRAVKANTISGWEYATAAIGSVGGGAGMTVTFVVAHAELKQAVMTAVPTDLPMTTPADAATATFGLDETQVADAVCGSTVPSVRVPMAVSERVLRTATDEVFEVTARLTTLTAVV